MGIRAWERDEGRCKHVLRRLAAPHHCSGSYRITSLKYGTLVAEEATNAFILAARAKISRWKEAEDNVGPVGG